MSLAFSCDTFVRTFKKAFTQDVGVVTNESRNNLDEQKDQHTCRLQEENDKLKSTNDYLTQRLNKFENAIDELTKKVKAAEDEKASLLTAIRLLHLDRNICLDTDDNRNAWSKVQTNNNQRNAKATSGTTKSRTTNAASGSNRFAPLTTEETEIDEVEIAREAAPTRKLNGQSTNQNQVSSKATYHNGTADARTEERRVQSTPTGRSTETVAIVGDSMIKHLNPRKLRNATNKRISIKTFPGATTNDLTYYVKPTLKTQPNNVVIHVGTNDLKKGSPENVINSLVKLGKSITQDLESVNLIFSSVITRTDDSNMTEKVKQYNNMLIEVCSQHRWGLIHNTNINSACLNQYGLHLNHKGSALLATNIKNFLNRS